MIEEVLAQKQSKDERQQILTMKKSMDSPLVDKIKHFRPPLNFVQPQFKEFFDGKNDDPVEHVQHFQASMSFWRYNDELLCRTFPITLTGKALTWFSQLESNLIANFGILSDAFFEQYKINLGSRKGSSHLFFLQQETCENLLDFTRRVGTLKELYNRAERYGRAEKEKKAKMSRASKGSRTEGNAKPKQQFEGDSKKKNQDESRSRSGNGEDARRNQGREKVKFSSLNIGLGELFKKIKDSLPAPKPLPVETKDKRDNNKYCGHHQDHGHNTDSCRTLAVEVQKMIEDGKLQQYVKKNLARVNALDLREIRVRHARVNSASRKAHEKATRLKLRHIHDWRISNKVDYANLIGTETLEEGKNEISFSNADLVGVYQPHNDATVILALIGMYKVRRVLVDTGSSISVIFSGAYSSMNFNEGQVEDEDNPIIGFSGETLTTIRRVSLLTIVGGRTVMQYFSLLDCRAHYNAILGRDWIHAMEAVTSTIHQCLKFITSVGVMKVRSDQVASHKCHESAMEEYRKSELKGSEILQVEKKA
ncbi:uncharacterized protein LOC113295282 [Papaver somniferum]|uniref:uncharacterized protein LOC113295282 n=1 Tax=Papaver somniferum TaxID=3469 RepID=UPI000E6FB65E|nr:uncharacterized protein LOC113295282 [Papaver somniferum]